MPWAWLAIVMVLTLIGICFVWSATYDSNASWGLGSLAIKQMQWWIIAGLGGILAMHVPFASVRLVVVGAWIAGVVMELLMMAAAGSALVPSIKGQANWLVLGAVSIQPAEFIKLTTLLALAWMVSMPEFTAHRFTHVIGAACVALIPAGLIAVGKDLGSALTFLPMTLGVLIAAGMRWRHVIIVGLLSGVMALLFLRALPHDGYQYKRLQAWLRPEEYALSEGYQTMRSVRSIGSGQMIGKGWGEGDQNRLGWLPEKHTDLIFAVVGEEAGFLGSSVVLLLFLGFAWLGLSRASICRDPCGRYFVTGYVCLVMGQASINVAVALGLMPVTGVTLPFFSYGGSSLLACYIGLGLAVSAGAAQRER